MIKVIARVNDPVINLGYQGEDNAREVVFDSVVNRWRLQLGEGVPSLKVTLPQTEQLYPAPLNVTLTTTRWVVHSADTQNAGSGQLQLVYTLPDGRATSRIWDTEVEESLGATTPQAPEEPWIDEVLQAGAAAQASATRAEKAADRAEQIIQGSGDSAAAAAQSAKEAKNFAELAGQHSQEAAAFSQSAGTASKDAAESAVRAEQAAAGNGYMSFEVDENGDLIFKKTANVTQVEFELKEGELIVYG